MIVSKQQYRKDSLSSKRIKHEFVTYATPHWEEHWNICITVYAWIQVWCINFSQVSQWISKAWYFNSNFNKIQKVNKCKKSIFFTLFWSFTWNFVQLFNKPLARESRSILHWFQGLNYFKVYQRVQKMFLFYLSHLLWSCFSLICKFADNKTC